MVDNSRPTFRILQMAEAIQRTSDTERDKLSVLLAIILASATLFRFVELPNVSWGVQSVLGSPLGFDFGGEMLVVILIVGLVSTGTLSILQDHPLRDTQERPLLFSLITPAIGSLLVSLLLIRATSWILWLVALFLGGVAIGLLVHLSYQAFSPANQFYPAQYHRLSDGFCSIQYAFARTGSGIGDWPSCTASQRPFSDRVA